LNTENDGMSIEQFIRNFSPEVEKWAKQNIYKYIGWVGDSREGVNDLYAVGMLELCSVFRVVNFQNPGHESYIYKKINGCMLNYIYKTYPFKLEKRIIKDGEFKIVEDDEFNSELSKIFNTLVYLSMNIRSENSVLLSQIRDSQFKLLSKIWDSLILFDANTRTDNSVLLSQTKNYKFSLYSLLCFYWIFTNKPVKVFIPHVQIDAIVNTPLEPRKNPKIEELLFLSQAQSLIAEFMEMLSPMERFILVSRYQDEKTYEEIGIVTGKRRETISRKVKEMLERLSKFLTRKGKWRLSQDDISDYLQNTDRWVNIIFEDDNPLPPVSRRSTHEKHRI